MHYVTAKGILSPQNGMNIYRGCTHGCIYCDSRSKCYGFTHPFEDIEVKENAPELLEQALKSKRKKCMIGTGSMTDPYLHLEETLKLTRRCLEIIDHYGFGLAIQTKSTRILRDLDILKTIHAKTKCVVQITLTTYDEEICKILEPHVSTTKERFEALKIFQKHGIPTIVWIAPILPFLNDSKENLEGLLAYCIEAGVKGILCFGMGVTLRDGDREYFYEQLQKHFPGVREKYIRTFGNAYECSSPNEKELMRIAESTCREHGMLFGPEECFAYLKEFPKNYEQLNMMDFLG